jgi:hypothetical protein
MITAFLKYYHELRGMSEEIWAKLMCGKNAGKMLPALLRTLIKLL